MKNLFNNLKPIIVYWASVSIYLLSLLSDILSFESCVAVLWISFLVLSIIMSVFNKLKDIFIGTIILEVQFLICGAIFLFEASKSPQEPSVTQNIASFGNFFMVGFKNHNVWELLATMLMPLIPLIIVGIKQYIGVGDDEKINDFKKNESAKALLNNLKPIVVYWVCVVLYFNIGLFDYFSYKTLCIIMWSAFVIFNIIMGLCNKPKDVYIGMIIVELQFMICGATYMFFSGTIKSGEDMTILQEIISYGNFMMTCFDDINVWRLLLTLLLPLTAFVGFELKNLCEQKKKA
ncbi:hypothetical protein [uncultured Eubacterium sp.]|uniref:hypothetical protein n=1 Tax=uncultured Eubacterium sp. TaxID=165185 RepID=UPI00260792F7|nr:hypothetical protein [uncultured Eubacterium sp.]